MEKIATRQAIESDLSTLLDFEQGIIQYERPYDPTLKKGISYYDIRAMIYDPEVRVVVATVGDELVGSAYGVIRKAKPYLDHDHYVYLGFMFVKPQYRGHGINMQIINDLKSWCLSKNIKELRLDVYAENKAALSAYEKAGFEHHLLNMRIRL